MTTTVQMGIATAASNEASFWEDEGHYLHRTLAEAERIWHQDKDDFNRMIRWTHAMHHLAEFYQKQADYTQAFHYLITPHNWVIQLLHDTSRSEDEITMALHALNVTFEPLYAFSLAHPCCDTCRQNLEETRAMLKQRAQYLH